jgi:hypothetical protein
MGKYSVRTNKPPAPKRNTVNPYMRGIGCLLMIVVPVFSFAVGDALADKGFGYQLIPREWYGNIILPPVIANSSPIVRSAANSLAGIPHLPATLVLTVGVMILLGGLMSVIFGWMYSLMAPSQYGPMDVPPPRVKTKKYKR